MHKILALLSISLLTGCVGLAVATYGKYESPREDFSLSDVRNEFGYRLNEKGFYSPDEVVDLWGEPDREERDGDCLVYVYNDGTSWAGVGAFVGVAPVPLGVPTGKYHNRIYFREQKSVGVVQEYGKVKGHVGPLCGSNDCSASSSSPNAPVESADSAIGRWCHHK